MMKTTRDFVDEIRAQRHAVEAKGKKSSAKRDMVTSALVESTKKTSKKLAKRSKVEISEGAFSDANMEKLSSAVTDRKARADNVLSGRVPEADMDTLERNVVHAVKAITEKAHATIHPFVMKTASPAPVVGNQSDLLTAVKAHAVKHADEGWDVVIEAWTDSEILEVIQWADYPRGAINLMSRHVKAARQRQFAANA